MDIPESEEVREHRRRFEPPDLGASMQRLRDWFEDLDPDEALKYYLAALIILVCFSSLFNCSIKLAAFLTRKDAHV